MGGLPVLCINPAVYRPRLALCRMPMRWPNAVCQSTGPVSREPPLAERVGLSTAQHPAVINVLLRGSSDASMRSCRVWMGWFNFALASFAFFCVYACCIVS